MDVSPRRPCPAAPLRPSGDNINRFAVAKYLYKTKYYTINITPLFQFPTVVFRI
jgi:hypothetical protein